MLRIICQEIHSRVTTCSAPMLHMENPHASQKGAKDGPPSNSGEIQNHILRCGIAVLRVTHPSRSWKGGGLDFLKRERHVCAFCLYRAVPAYYCPRPAEPLIFTIRR
jgi:hypothetical protein